MTKAKESDALQELCEVSWEPFEVKEEFDEKSGKTRMRVEGVIQHADIINQNNRIYPKSVMVKAVKELRPKIEAGQVFGELDHPTFYASLKDTSHLVTKVWWDENNDKVLRGEMLILDTKNGQILQEILRAGGRPGFSSRGRGELAKKKVKGGGEVYVVKPGFRFSSFDFVIDPSVKSAQITKIIEQNLLNRTDSEEESHCKDEWYEDCFVDETPKEEKSMTKKKEEEEKKEQTSASEETDDKKKEETETEVEKGKEKKKEGEQEVDKLKAEVEKLRKEKADLESQIATKDEQIEKQLSALSGVVAEVEKMSSILRDAGFMKAPEEKKEEEKEEEETKLADLEAKVENLETELSATKEELRKKEVEAHIAKVLEGEAFAVVLKERLKDCKTVEEVDARLETDRALVKQILTEGEVLAAGKGRVVVKGESKIKKDAKRIAGIREKKEEK